MDHILLVTYRRVYKTWPCRAVAASQQPPAAFTSASYVFLSTFQLRTFDFFMIFVILMRKLMELDDAADGDAKGRRRITVLITRYI